MAGRAARVLPADPIRPVRTVLSLPDGDSLLHAINHEPTSTEGLIAMGSARCADHRDLTDLERAHAVHSSHACPRDLGLDLGSNAIHLGDRHRRVGLVFELGHRAPIVDIAHGSDEKRGSARARVRDERRYFVDGKWFEPNSDS